MGMPRALKTSVDALVIIRDMGCELRRQILQRQIPHFMVNNNDLGSCNCGSCTAALTINQMMNEHKGVASYILAKRFLKQNN